MTTLSPPQGPAWLLTRVVVVPAVVLLLVVGYVVVTRAMAVRDATREISDKDRPAIEQTWRASYSRKFPGCVPAVLWPGRETPKAVVVRWGSGQVDRVARGVALRRALSGTASDDTRIIGACYR